MGAKFSTSSYSTSNPPPQNNFSQIYSNAIISDTANWTRIFGSFIADSVYTHIIIGTFFDNSNVSIIDLFPANNSSYYFVDDICVSTDSLFSLNYTYTNVPELLQEHISIYPNPISNYINIDLPALKESFEIKIHNVLGQEIFFKQKAKTSHIQIDISNIKESILILTIKNKDHLFNYKLLKL